MPRAWLASAAARLANALDAETAAPVASTRLMKERRGLDCFEIVAVFEWLIVSPPVEFSPEFQASTAT